ncbi:MAG: metallophosphoesterase [Clostridiales bacterium]|nr:metallophosphoesterase [Clostridiales bacterium]
MKKEIYLIADTHFYHKNIIKYCNRPFKTVEDMNESIISNWNSVVKGNDMVYHLGDVALCSNELLSPIIKRLNGKKYLIRGNHDSRGAIAFEDMGFIILRNPPIQLKEYKVVLSHIPLPDMQIPAGFVNIHGHIHNVPLHNVGRERENGFFEEYPKDKYSADKHICVSVDVTDFKPVNINDLI